MSYKYMGVLSNIPKLYGISIINNSLIILPVIVLYFQDFGLSLSEVFVLQSIFAGAVVLLEIPTGYLGDILRRKDSLIIGAIMATIGWIIFYFSDSFLLFAVSEVLFALAYTFNSGSDSALLYDTLLSESKEDQFQKIKGRYSARGNFSEAGGALLGGFLATISFQLAAGVQIRISLIAIVLAWMLIEPPREKYEITETGFKHLLGVVRYALFTHQGISALIIYSGITGLVSMFRVRSAQPYWELVGVPIVFFGVLWAVGNASVGLFSWFAEHSIKRLSHTNLLLGLPLLGVLAYMLLGGYPSIFMISAMFILYGVRGVLSVLYSDMINQQVSSKERATVLSVKSLTFRFFFMITGPLIGLVADAYGVFNSLIFGGVLLFVLICLGSILLYKNGIISRKVT